MIAGDPLMTKVLIFRARRQLRQPTTPIKTVTSAPVMTGSRRFRVFGPQPMAELLLVDEPEGHAGLGAAMRRAHRGADFALSFAIHRLDSEAALVCAVALLHDFAELLLWCFAPKLQPQIADLQLANPALRSSVAQRRVLNVEVSGTAPAAR